MSLTNGLLGGALIGAAAGSLLLFTGQVMGASGIVNSTLLLPTKTFTESPSKIAFVGSFLTIASQLTPKSNTLDLSAVAYGIAGLCVGFGTKLSNGCTSGHGICGLARLSKRSLAAVLTFMASAMATVSLIRPLEFIPSAQVSLISESALPSMLGPLLLALSAISYLKSKGQALSTVAASAFSGGVFAYGLFISDMVSQDRVLGFLNLSPQEWDPTLMFVMAGGLGVSLLSYQFKGPRPYCELDYKVPTNQTIDKRLLTGAALFGLGWGIAGLCPGPALFQAVKSPTIVSFWWPAYIAGAYLATLT